MFLTQTYADLGCPVIWVPVGIYTDTDDPTKESSTYGAGQSAALKNMLAKFLKAYPEERLLNVVVTRIPSPHCHPDYDRWIWRVTGDRYKVKVSSLD